MPVPRPSAQPRAQAQPSQQVSTGDPRLDAQQQRGGARSQRNKDAETFGDLALGGGGGGAGGAAAGDAASSRAARGRAPSAVPLGIS